MKHVRKKMSDEKLALIQKIQKKAGQTRFANSQARDEPITTQAPIDATTPDFKHTLPTQGTLHRRHK